MDKIELEQIKQKKEQEAKEIFKLLQIDDNDRALAPYYRPIPPRRRISPYRGPHYVDYYRFTDPDRQDGGWRNEKEKPVRIGLSHTTTPLPFIEN